MIGGKCYEQTVYPKHCFLIVSIIAFIPLTIEVFGGMNPDIMIVSVCVMGIGILGNSICAIIRAIKKKEKVL